MHARTSDPHPASNPAIPLTSELAHTVHVVLPAYNEAASIGSVLKALEQARGETGMRLHAIIVDDGSVDDTRAVVRGYRGDLPVTLVEHPGNMGLGAAIRSGLLRAVEEASDRDIIVTMDADDTHTPAAIGQMTAQIEEGLDVLIASRYQRGSVVVGVPLMRRFLSYAASILFRAAFPIRGVKDFTCGYRAYRASVLRAAFARYRQEFVNQEGFQCMVDILLKLRPLNLRFGEVPLILRYDRKGGKSKMKVASTVFKTLVLLAKRRLGL
jgi:dolichol-phosphate mannosyltransferase